MNKYLHQIIDIALPNKYTKWYISIINNAMQNHCYIEKHHILPKCFKMGGEKDEDNLIKLSAREHFVCHLLLVKMFSGRKRFQLNYALQRMCTKQNGMINRYMPKSSIFYEMAKKIQSDLMKNCCKDKQTIFSCVNPNSDGKQAKKAWEKATNQRRLNQSKIMTEVNKKYKTKPKVLRYYICETCNDIFSKLEIITNIPKKPKTCGHICNGKRTGRLIKQKNFKNIIYSEIQRICEWCGDKYNTTTKSKSKFCSQSCTMKSAFHNKKRTAWNKGKNNTGWGLNNPMKNPVSIEKMIMTRKKKREVRVLDNKEPA